MNESRSKQDRNETTVVPVRRPAIDDRASGVDPGRRLGPFVLVGTAVLLVAALIGVFAYLPERVEEPMGEPAPVVVDEEPVSSEPPLTREQREALREEAEQLLAQLLEQRVEVEARAAPSWGGDDWDAYLESARRADDALLADEPREAVAHYQEAIGIGERLFRRSEEIMVNATAAGEDALAAGNPDLATTQFALVLSVDPDNARALAGQARAATLPDVLAAMRRGDEALAADDLAAAADAYREALAIDSAWTAARTALTDVTGEIAERRFDRLITDAYTALDDGRFDAAVELFAEALTLEPQSDAARDGLAQAEAGQVRNSLVMAEVRGQAFERREMWDEAMARYREALAIDPALAFAIEGLARAQRRADLEAKLDTLTGSPRLLLEEAVLADARAVLADARAVDEPGPRHETLTDRLEALIELASTPIPVTLVSDNATEVSVYRVGELGTFTTRELSLKPGRYTAIGARRGYRDVRETFTVLPGQDNAPVTVVCEEPI